jgi:hypothetical protein
MDAARGLVRKVAGAGKQAAAEQLNKPLVWAETELIPKIIDDLMPYLIASVVPRIIDGVLPYIREKVLPIVIEDLTDSAQLRDLITEQSRDVVADAAMDLRDSTAAADDRIESGIRRLLHLAPTQ